MDRFRRFLTPDVDSALLKKNYYTIKTGDIEDYSPNISKNRWKTFILSGNSAIYKFRRDFFFEYYKNMIFKQTIY